MPTKDALLEIVPIGEENAVSSRLLWQQLGMWSLASIRRRLNEMAAAVSLNESEFGEMQG